MLALINMDDGGDARARREGAYGESRHTSKMRKRATKYSEWAPEYQQKCENRREKIKLHLGSRLGLSGASLLPPSRVRWTLRGGWGTVHVVFSANPPKGYMYTSVLHVKHMGIGMEKGNSLLSFPLSLSAVAADATLSAESPRPRTNEEQPAGR